jgi:hypothetical protein
MYLSIYGLIYTKISLSISLCNYLIDNKEYFPTLSEVIEAKENYFLLAKKYKIKDKFIKFHKLNFQRLEKIAKTGNKNLKLLTPNNIHLS